MSKQKTFGKWGMNSTDECYAIAVICKNCFDYSHMSVKKGFKINRSHLKFVKCSKCEVKGMLVQARWNGIKYEEIKN